MYRKVHPVCSSRYMKEFSRLTATIREAVGLYTICRKTSHIQITIIFRQGMIFAIRGSHEVVLKTAGVRRSY
jgi:hypothetical protein